MKKTILLSLIVLTSGIRCIADDIGESDYAEIKMNAKMAIKNLDATEFNTQCAAINYTGERTNLLISELQQDATARLNQVNQFTPATYKATKLKQTFMGLGLILAGVIASSHVDFSYDKFVKSQDTYDLYWWGGSSIGVMGYLGLAWHYTLGNTIKGLRGLLHDPAKRVQTLQQNASSINTAAKKLTSSMPVGPSSN